MFGIARQFNHPCIENIVASMSRGGLLCVERRYNVPDRVYGYKFATADQSGRDTANHR